MTEPVYTNPGFEDTSTEEYIRLTESTSVENTTPAASSSDGSKKWAYFGWGVFGVFVMACIIGTLFFIGSMIYDEGFDAGCRTALHKAYCPVDHQGR